MRHQALYSDARLGRHGLKQGFSPVAAIASQKAKRRQNRLHGCRFPG
ncbi:MAG: hypothetical protein RBJ76_10855 [Stenomitos frigidus ULC029]